MAERLLTDRQCRAASPERKVSYLNDGNGLRLLIKPDGAKSWVLRYWIGGKEYATGLGAYPSTTLVEARDKAKDARKIAAEGRSPILERKLRIEKNVQREASTFEAVARDWLDEDRKPAWSDHHRERNEGLLRRIIFPELGALPTDEITEAALLDVLKKAYKRTPVSARRALAVTRQVFSYAKVHQRATHNPALELSMNREILAKPSVESFAAMKVEDVGAFLRALQASDKVEPITKAALLIMLYTGVRDFSLRATQWREIDLKLALWTIPHERRKVRRKTKGDFLVPLPKQALAVLAELAKLTNGGPDSFVFASQRSKTGYLAENTLRLAMHDLGFEVTAHGLRSTLTDLLNLNHFNVDAIERQLDHVLGHISGKKGEVRDVYLRTDYINYRRDMMQWVGDWADAQKAGKKGPALPGNMYELRRSA